MARRKRYKRSSGPGKGALQIQLKVIMDNVTAEVQKSLYEACDKVGEECVQKLKNTSPKKTGDYRKGWTYTKTPSGGVVHNATDYQLTHLLEKGHVVRNKKGTYGRAPAKVHIAPVEEWANDELVKETERLINDNI